MHRVQCSLCEFEKNGLCLKKKIKVKVKKRRSCDVYSEDVMRVVADFRKKEKHKAVLETGKKLRQSIENIKNKREA